MLEHSKGHTFLQLGERDSCYIFVLIPSHTTITCLLSVAHEYAFLPHTSVHLYIFDCTNSYMRACPHFLSCISLVHALMHVEAPLNIHS